MDFAVPYAIDATGRTATAPFETHVRDMIGQVLFTAPGERVNRPTFGCGLGGLVFEPIGAEIAAAAGLHAHGALQLWLGDLIEVQDVAVKVGDGMLSITVQYVLRRSQQPRIAEFRRSAVPS
jgi:phage baseplate assembly protein W